MYFKIAIQSKEADIREYVHAASLPYSTGIEQKNSSNFYGTHFIPPLSLALAGSPRDCQMTYSLTLSNT